jgi:hypothetical protein
MPGKKGVPFCPGGARKGAGRKPSEFLEKCRELAGSKKFLGWADDVLAGKPVETKATMTGVVKVPASTGDRVYLWEKLAAYGFGKPMQAVELSGKDGGPITIAELVEKNVD